MTCLEFSIGCFSYFFRFEKLLAAWQCHHCLLAAVKHTGDSHAERQITVSDTDPYFNCNAALVSVGHSYAW